MEQKGNEKEILFVFIVIVIIKQKSRTKKTKKKNVFQKLIKQK